MCGSVLICFCSLPSPPSAFHCVQYHCERCLSFQGLGCQVLSAIGAASVVELAANIGSSRTSQAPKLHLVTQLFMLFDLVSFLFAIVPLYGKEYMTNENKY